MRLFRGSALGLVALVAAVPLAGCQTPDNTATLTYDQTANFLEYSIDGTGSGHHAAQNRSFVLYRIVSVDNTGSKALPFTLDPVKQRQATRKASAQITLVVRNKCWVGSCFRKST